MDAFWRRFKFIATCSLLILATYNIIKTTVDIYKSSRRLDELKTELAADNKENASLKKDLAYKSSPAFIEEEARNKLNMVKPGETLVVTDKSEVESSPSESFDDQIGTTGKSNLDKWLALFF